jgi:hypothetical protein
MSRGAFFCCCLLASAPAFACDYPTQLPEIPDGKTATNDQMITAQNAVKDYVAKMNAYLSCLDDEVNALGDTVTDAQKKVQVEKHNAAVDAMQGLADKYNAEVRAYKEAQQDSERH